MNFWTGKCFNCYIAGVLAFMSFMTIKEIKNENRKRKIKLKYEKTIIGIANDAVVDSSSTKKM